MPVNIYLVIDLNQPNDNIRAHETEQLARQQAKEYAQFYSNNGQKTIKPILLLPALATTLYEGWDNSRNDN